MSKSTKSIFNDMKKSYNKAMKQERKRYGLPVNRKPYYWEKNSVKSKPYKSRSTSNIKMPKTTSTSNQQSTENGCYIATCIYGSYDCPEVWTLRRFRDCTLDKTWYGKAFIKCYYFVSPKIVKLFGKSNLFKKMGRKYLNILVKKLNKKGVSSTEYIDKY